MLNTFKKYCHFGNLPDQFIANAHARLHTTAVRESAALHSGKELYTVILGSFRQARLLGPFRTCFRVYDGKARGI